MYRKIILSSLYGKFGTMSKKSKLKKSKSELTVGQRIAAAIKKADTSIAATAAKADLSASFLSLVVSDKRQLSAPSILKVADVLGIKASTLLTDSQREDLKALQACTNA